MQTDSNHQLLTSPWKSISTPYESNALITATWPFSEAIASADLPSYHKACDACRFMTLDVKVIFGRQNVALYLQMVQVYIMRRLFSQYFTHDALLSFRGDVEELCLHVVQGPGCSLMFSCSFVRWNISVGLRYFVILPKARESVLLYYRRTPATKQAMSSLFF